MDVASVLKEYVEPATSAFLREAAGLVDEHIESVRNAADEHDFIDVGLGERIAEVLHALIEGAETYTAKERALLRGAIRYFTQHDDEIADLQSPTGMDDDAEVLNAVSAFLGRNDLVITI